jgi:hypothetical protein
VRSAQRQHAQGLQAQSGIAAGHQNRAPLKRKSRRDFFGGTAVAEATRSARGKSGVE